MILSLIDEAVAAGARQAPAAELLGLDPRTVGRWRTRGTFEDLRRGPDTPPSNQLSDEERQRVLDILNSREFRDLPPSQIVPLLADRREYYASESTMYRILRQEKLNTHRSNTRPPTRRHRPDEYVTTGPNQVWTWDITYLRSAVQGSFWYLYMVLDVWSRKVVAWEVHPEETSEHASALLAHAYRDEGVTPGSLTIHMDNGSPMKGATLQATLQNLGVATSYSRPSVSNDNPYSESLFRTLKYRPGYPSNPFDTLDEARRWVSDFVCWYNTQHLHSAIRYITPADRHAGRDEAILLKRRQVYEDARQQRPERWPTPKTRNWDRIKEVKLNPERQTHTRRA